MVQVDTVDTKNINNKKHFWILNAKFKIFIIHTADSVNKWEELFYNEGTECLF